MAQILQLALCWTTQAVAGALEALGRRGPVSPATRLLLIAPDLLWSASSRMCSLPATMAAHRAPEVNSISVGPPQWAEPGASGPRRPVLVVPL